MQVLEEIMFNIFKKKLKKFKPSVIWDRKNKRYIDLGMARELKSWEIDTHSTDYYYAYELEDGSVIVYHEMWFIYFESSDIHKYDSVKTFYNDWFPKPKIVNIKEVV
jgi:hypothetical protein